MAYIAKGFYSLLRESGSLTLGVIALVALVFSIGFYSLLRESGSLTLQLGP